MRRESLTTLKSKLPRYEHVASLITFVRQVQKELRPAAIILFGSLTKGNYYRHSDADVCVILEQPQADWTTDYERVAPLDSEGVIELLVYGKDQFLDMGGMRTPWR